MMKADAARSWKKIGCFYALTMLFAGVFGAFVMHAGKMEAGSIERMKEKGRRMK
jgi:hypothetical protein